MNPDKKIGYQGLESGAFNSDGPETNDPNRMLVDQVFGDAGFQIKKWKVDLERVQDELLISLNEGEEAFTSKKEKLLESVSWDKCEEILREFYLNQLNPTHHNYQFVTDSMIELDFLDNAEKLDYVNFIEPELREVSSRAQSSID